MTKVTEFVKISTLVLVQQQQLGSLLLSSRSTLRLAVAVRLVIPLLYSLKRFDAVGPLLLRPIPSPVAGKAQCAHAAVGSLQQTCRGRGHFQLTTRLHMLAFLKHF